MKEIPPFVFQRARGIVWVCDIEKSSSYLNSAELVDEIEQYIPRLFYCSKTLVESYGGSFMKWTGDGFLAWFEIELDRHRVEKAAKVIEAAMHLSLISNVTQLGLETKDKIKLRHGISYEQDALLMTLKEEGNYSFDIIGRSVVLAFRLSSIKCDFPNISTTKEILPKNTKGFSFKKWNPKKDDKLKYFKGEELGIDQIYVSTSSEFKPGDFKNAVKEAQGILVEMDETKINNNHLDVLSFTNKMMNGSDWSREIIEKYVDFVREEMLETFREVVERMSVLEEEALKQKNRQDLLRGKDFLKYPWSLNYWGSNNQAKTVRIVDDAMIFEAKSDELVDPRKQYGAFLDFCEGIIPYNEYEVYCFVKSIPGTTMKFQLWLHDKHGYDSEMFPKEPFVPSADGQHIKARFKATASGCIRIHLHNYAGDGQIIVQEVSVRKI